ncbi:MAG: hypothetical protein ACOVKC_03190 [Brevundimonas sp.]
MPAADPYHTALSRGVAADVDPVHYWRGPKGDLAMVWDLAKGHPRGPVCDLIYADLPWRPGYEAFNARAGHAGVPFLTFMQAADRFAQEARSRGAVALLTMSEVLAAKMMTPDRLIPVKLNGDRVGLAIYGEIRLEIVPGEPVEGLLHSLAAVHDRVLDPCCGYGRTARAFARAGKRFTATDINAGCIGRVVADAPSWMPE